MSRRKKKQKSPYKCNLGFNINNNLEGGITGNNGTDKVIGNFRKFKDLVSYGEDKFPYIFIVLDGEVSVTGKNVRSVTLDNELDALEVFKNKKVRGVNDILTEYGALPMGYRCCGYPTKDPEDIKPQNCDQCKYFSKSNLIL